MSIEKQESFGFSDDMDNSVKEFFQVLLLICLVLCVYLGG